MAVAGKKGEILPLDKTIKVATKFPCIAKKHFASKSRKIDIIKLNGSIELAPILGMSDVIVDIVETGTTLKENNLEVYEDIVNISARFISNKTAFRFKTQEIELMKSKIEKELMQ
jgi:ATP phosphoribosyltransferase